MKNNSIVEYKKNIISRIKKYFLNLFKSKDTFNNSVDENVNVDIEIDINKIKENDFFENLKVNTNDFSKLNNKNDFLKYIDGNINALDSLSVDRLKKLKEYYAQVIEENDIIINQLKKSN